MCDYSLEAYKSRPARKGEEYVLHRFPSGSKGFVSAGDCQTAVCMAADTRLRLSGLSVEGSDLQGVGPVEEVTFVQLEHGWYRDGVRFANGVECSLQRLPIGVKATVTQDLEEPSQVAEAVEAV